MSAGTADAASGWPWSGRCPTMRPVGKGATTSRHLRRSGQRRRDRMPGGLCGGAREAVRIARGRCRGARRVARDEDADLDGPRSPRRPLAPSSPAAASISSCWQCRARGRGSRFRRQHDGQGSWAVAAKRAAITPVVPAGPDPARWRRSSSAICRWSGQADDQRFSCGPRRPSWPGACPVGSHEVTARRTAGVPSSPPVVPGRRSRLRHRSRMPGSPWSRSRHGRRCPDKETSSRSRRLRG